MNCSTTAHRSSSALHSHTQVLSSCYKQGSSKVYQHQAGHPWLIVLAGATKTLAPPLPTILIVPVLIPLSGITDVGSMFLLPFTLGIPIIVQDLPYPLGTTHSHTKTAYRHLAAPAWEGAVQVFTEARSMAGAEGRTLSLVPLRGREAQAHLQCLIKLFQAISSHVRTTSHP